MFPNGALITVAAAAKGPFFPSDYLLRGESELGWKGSAVTSAFCLVDEKQLKMYQQMVASSGILKTKEPDGWWDGDRISYKHPSWQ
nr:bromo adjacent homology (BAH) domain, transcription factor IIS [Tanacetum cinerariifolium]